MLIAVLAGLLLLRTAIGDITNATLSKYITCNNGERLDRNHICDGIIHCSDASDEKYVGTGFKCSVMSSTRNKQNRRCVLPQEMLHDDVADCEDRTDVCYDSKDQLMTSKCFKCFDGIKTISLTQVCDGIIDCDDISDECACIKRKRKKYGKALNRNPICDQIRYVEIRTSSGQQKPHAGRIPRNTACEVGQIECKTAESDDVNVANDVIENCVTANQLCDGNQDCPLGDDEEYCPKSNYFCIGSNNTGTFCDGKIDCPHFDDECSPKCWLRHQYCNDVISLTSHVNRTVLSCQSTQGNTSEDSYVIAKEVCDGAIDCKNGGNDEAHCLPSTHFYCIGKSPLFVNWSRRYDDTRDCDDGSDECQRMFNSSRDNTFRQRDALIRNFILEIFIWFMGVMALFGNAAVIYQTFSELWKDRRYEKLGKLAKCNRIFVFNLSAADFLMGVYLITIGIESAASNGRYCVTDRIWRSSATCISLGVINQISSQTSVFMLLLMTSYRLYGSLRPFKVERSATVQSSVVSCICMWIISITVAVIPLINSLSDYFIERLWLPLPFVPMDLIREKEMREFILRANTLTYNTTDALPDLSWDTMINYLRDIKVTGLHHKWNLDDIKPFGYYNWFSICMPNLYPNVNDIAWVYATCVIAFNFCAFCYITIAYVIIYKASSKPAVRKSVRKRSRQWRRDSKTMQKKIFLLVATDVLCWLPICIIFLYHIVNGRHIERGLVDFTGTVLLPINSAINPLLYSHALWKLKDFVLHKLCPKPASKRDFLPYSYFKTDSVSSTGNNDVINRAVRFEGHGKEENMIEPSLTVQIKEHSDVTKGVENVIQKGTDVIEKKTDVTKDSTLRASEHVSLCDSKINKYEATKDNSGSLCGDNSIYKFSDCEVRCEDSMTSQNRSSENFTLLAELQQETTL